MSDEVSDGPKMVLVCPTHGRISEDRAVTVEERCEVTFHRDTCPDCGSDLTDRTEHELRATLEALVKQIDVVQGSADYQYHWSMAHMHAGDYAGPNYGEELKAARAVLEGK